MPAPRRRCRALCCTFMFIQTTRLHLTHPPPTHPSTNTHTQKRTLLYSCRTRNVACLLYAKERGRWGKRADKEIEEFHARRQCRASVLYLLFKDRIRPHDACRLRLGWNYNSVIFHECFRISISSWLRMKGRIQNKKRYHRENSFIDDGYTIKYCTFTFLWL